MRLLAHAMAHVRRCSGLMLSASSVCNHAAMKVWSSTLKRARMTAYPLSKMYAYNALKSLDEINAGVCDGMTYEEIRVRTIIAKNTFD